MWRIVITVLAVATLFLGGSWGVADVRGGQDLGHHATLSDGEPGPSCHVLTGLSHDDRGSLACCPGHPCMTCVVAIGASYLKTPTGEPSRQAFRDPTLYWFGRVILPPTAPPKIA